MKCIMLSDVRKEESEERTRFWPRVIGELCGGNPREAVSGCL